jgi:hypothetical protein
MDAFTEDWNASQFWYNDETATTLAQQLLDGATDDTKIAVVSAPSAFIQLKNLMVSRMGNEVGCCLISAGVRRVQVQTGDQTPRVRRALCRL